MNKNTNFYERVPKDLVKKFHNPSKKYHGMEIPFRILIIGGCGTGKTNTLMEMIHRMNKTFERIIICCADKHEPLYLTFHREHPEGVDFYEHEVPPIEEMKDCGQTLIVFDDLVLDKDQTPMKEYFMRGRKVGDGISCAYLTQNFHSTPTFVRRNCDYVILKRIDDDDDLRRILKHFALGVNFEKLKKMYAYATDDPLSFLMIDKSLGTKAQNRFRVGFLDVIDISDPSFNVPTLEEIGGIIVKKSTRKSKK